MNDQTSDATSDGPRRLLPATAAVAAGAVGLAAMATRAFGQEERRLPGAVGCWKGRGLSRRINGAQPSWR